jgi:co-chaperonin GroES (HSP10)
VEAIASTAELTEEFPEPDSWLAVGDIVIFGKYSGTELTINRDKFIICRETDILARIRKKDG